MANEDSWRTGASRKNVIGKIEEVAKKAGKVLIKSSKELENCIFVNVQTKKQYLIYLQTLLSKIENGEENTPDHNISSPVKCKSQVSENGNESVSGQPYSNSIEISEPVPPDNSPTAEDSNSSDELSSSDDSSSDSDSENSTSGSTLTPAEQSFNENALPAEDNTVDDTNDNNHCTSQDIVNDNLAVSQDASPNSDDETVSNVDCSQKSPLASRDSDYGTDNREVNATPTWQINPTPNYPPPTPRLRIKSELFRTALSPVRETEPNINDIAYEAGPSTSRMQLKGEVKKSPATVTRINGNGVSTEMASEARIPPLRINLLSKAIKRKKKAYSSEQFRRMYFRKKLEVAQFELRSKKVLHKLDCALKRQQLNKLMNT